MAGAGGSAKELACLGVGRYRASRCARMHRYAAKRAMDGGVCYAPGERGEVWFDATAVVSAAERQTWLCLLLGQARSSADMQGRAKWAWLEDRRSSSQLRAGQAMARVGHEVMRVRRPSKAVPFGLPIPFTLARLVLCGEEEWKRRLPGYGYFRLKMPKLDQPLPVANLTSPTPIMYTCATFVSPCFLHTCTELLHESERLGPKCTASISIDNSTSG